MPKGGGRLQIHQIPKGARDAIQVGLAEQPPRLRFGRDHRGADVDGLQLGQQAPADPCERLGQPRVQVTTAALPDRGHRGIGTPQPVEQGGVRGDMRDPGGQGDRLAGQPLPALAVPPLKRLVDRVLHARRQTKAAGRADRDLTGGPLQRGTDLGTADQRGGAHPQFGAQRQAPHHPGKPGGEHLGGDAEVGTRP